MILFLLWFFEIFLYLLIQIISIRADIMPCSVIQLSHIIGRKWSVPIIGEIALGKFNGFNRFLMKSQNMTARTLSRQLKELGTAGLIKKRNYMHNNRSLTEYSLTEKGMEMHEIIKEIKKWNIRWGRVPDHCIKITCTECEKYKEL